MYIIVHTYMYIDDYRVHTDTNIHIISTEYMYVRTHELITTVPIQGRGNSTSTVILGADTGNDMTELLRYN